MNAPDFSLPDQFGQNHSLQDYAGKWLVLYFYPKDDTPGCTKEACSFRDYSAEFKNSEVEVVGISKDTVTTHKKFAEKYKLNFTLLSDPDHQVIEKYGSWLRKKFMGREYDGTNRDTYIINTKGEIVKKYTGVNPLSHVSQVLKDIETLKN